MSHLYEEITTELKADRPVVMATVVNRRGSAPRGMGARMIIRADGSISGTIGGGLLEGQSMDEAARVFETGSASLLEFDLMGEGAEAAGMICGGAVDVFLEFFHSGDHQAIDQLERLITLSRRSRQAMVALELTPGPARGRRLIWEASAREEPPAVDWPGVITDYRQRIDGAGVPRPRNLDGWYVEPVQAAPTVYIFGGGHVSAQIAPLAAMVDFKVVVIDDRAEFASAERFPLAEEVIAAPYEEAVAGLDLGPWAYVVIVTRGHAWDLQVLRMLLSQPTAYLGMIGSRRKRNAIYQAILKSGYTEDDLARVYSPIGLDIAAETPEEIAVSIVAELIKVRAGESKPPSKKWVV